MPVEEWEAYEDFWNTPDDPDDWKSEAEGDDDAEFESDE
jgi:hypothetical protein